MKYVLLICLTLPYREGVHSQQVGFATYELCKEAEKQVNETMTYGHSICLKVAP